MYTLIRKWEASGLSQAKFFTEHKISKSTFGYWRKKYLREQEQLKEKGKMIPIRTRWRASLPKIPLCLIILKTY